MKPITRSLIYKKLDELRSMGLSIDNYVEMMIGSDVVPYEVVVFVNTHSPISSLSTYNNIYNKRRKSPLFRNITRKNLDVTEKAITLSSILNQSLISIKHNCEKESAMDSVNAELIIDALYQYSKGDSTEVESLFEAFRTVFNTLFPKKER